MAKKNIRSDKSDSPTGQPAIERRRAARATTHKPATSPDVPVAEPDDSPAVVRATAHDLRTDGNGHGHATSCPGLRRLDPRGALAPFAKLGKRPTTNSQLPKGLSAQLLEVGSWRLGID